MKITQSLKRSFHNDILVYKLNLIIIWKELGLKQSLYCKLTFIKVLDSFCIIVIKILFIFFSIAEKKSTLRDSRTPINRYAWAKQKSRLIFRYASYLQPKYILVLVVLNSTRHYTVASRHRAQTGPFAINVYWTFIERSVLFGRLAVSYNLNCYEN
jgi:hypothetical protein